MKTSQITILPYARRFRRDVLRLISQEDRLHLHLDWNTVDEWLGEPETPLFLAWQDRTLVGAMAAAPALEHSTWLRLAVIGEEADVNRVFEALWDSLKADLIAKGLREIAVLLLRPWIAEYVGRLGFAPRETIVTLRRDGAAMPQPLRTDIKVRGAEWRELPRIVEVDHAAFRAIWQLTPTSLRQAARMSTSFRVAELDRQIVAYQLSMQYHDGGHLARLATLPNLQGTGIGGALLGDMIEQFLRRGVHSVTVNTNESNTQSLHLYRRYGFELTGMNMDVWALNM